MSKPDEFPKKVDSVVKKTKDARLPLEAERVNY